MARVLAENRQYRRILLSTQSTKTLEEKGFETLFSSNVSAAAVRDNDLIIRFHNGSIYRYPNKADQYERLLAAASHGKWVWRFLRRTNVPYQKIGSLPLPEDRIVEDKEIMKPPTAIIETIVPIDALTTGKLPTISIKPVIPTIASGGGLETMMALANII